MTVASERKWLIPYPAQRALEDVAYGHGLTPTRIFALMLPVWQVEVEATTTEGRPYELIDRYVERAIADAQLFTVAELSSFLSLELALVDRAVRVLLAIGHLTVRGDALELTQLGWQSVRDGVCYLMSVQDRREMYFDAYHSRPLTRKYYDPRVVTLLSVQDVSSAVGDGPSFLMLHSMSGFRRDALTELAANPRRDHYNLPARIEHPKSLGEELVYLPMYVVRAVDAGGRPKYLAYTQAADTSDPDFNDLLAQTPEITAALDSEHRAATHGDNRVKRWLERHNVSQCQPVRTNQGLWRVVLPESAFEPVGPVASAKVGSFQVLDQDVVHVWCEARAVRERVLFDRVDALVPARKSVDVPAHIARISVQLGFGALDPTDLRRMATAAGRHGLARKLTAIATSENDG